MLSSTMPIQDPPSYNPSLSSFDEAEEIMTVDLQAAVKALKELGIEADAPDQSGNAEGFQDRLVLNIRGICIDEFSDWVSIELRHLDPNSEWYEGDK